MTATSREFSIGQKVKLNSGSPDLTVIELGGGIKVEWLTGSHKSSYTFPSACLTPAKGEGIDG